MKVYFPDLSHRLWYWVIGQKYFNLIFFWNHKNSTSICILHWRFEGHRTHEKNRNYLSNWKNLASQLSLSLNVIKNAERKKCLKRHILKHHSMSSVLFSCFFLPFCWFDSLFSLCSLESIVVTICFLFVLFKSVNRYTINYYDRTPSYTLHTKMNENTRKYEKKIVCHTRVRKTFHRIWHHIYHRHNRHVNFVSFSRWFDSFAAF